MAKVDRLDGSIVSGKMSKQSKEVHRRRNGVEYTYTMNFYTGPATKAQKLVRAKHAAISSVLNSMMADPEQAKQLAAQMKEYNRTVLAGSKKKFRTPRQFGYFLLRQQYDLAHPVTQQKPTAQTPLPRGITLSVKPFADLLPAELYEILKARFTVFVLEQGIRYLDEDGIDYTATHLALRRKGVVVAYVRLFETKRDQLTYDQLIQHQSEPRVFCAGRMLTTERGKGFGRILIQHLIAEAKRQGADILRVHAQVSAVPFYRHFRFAVKSEPFIEADIPHIIMERKLTRRS